MVETKMQSGDSGEESVYTNSTIRESTPTTQPQLQLRGSFQVLYPAYLSPDFPFPLSLWTAGYVREPTKKEEKHEIYRPTAVHLKAPINVDDLFGMTTKLSLGEPKRNGESDLSLSLKLGGGSETRQSPFHPNASPDSSDMANVIHVV